MIRWISLALVAPLMAAVAVAAPAAKPRWSKKLGRPAGITALHAVDGVVVAGTWEMRVIALDARTGRKLWSKQRPEVPGEELAVAVSGGHVIATTPEHTELVAYELRRGRQAWKRDLPPIGSLAACPGHRLVAVTHRGRGPDGATTLLAHALDPVSGKTLWQTPVDGPLSGGGHGWLVATTASGTGRLRSGLVALRCSDGAPRPLPGPRRPYARFLHAAEGKVVSAHFEQAFQRELLCVTDIETGDQHCLPPTDGQAPALIVSGAVLAGGVVHFATTRIVAKNLDPRPDGWVFRYDIADRAVTGKSEPLTSSGELVAAGDQLVTGFGSTGADDAGYIIDPATGARLAAVPLRKKPMAAAADRERAYFGTYDGRVLAVALPRPGPAPVSERPVTARPLPKQGPGPDLGWRLARTFDAHPRRARTSGAQTDGTVTALAFLDDGRLAAGGNDDRVSVHDIERGKRLWRSRKLGKDITGLGACGDTFAANTYAGRVTVFEPARSGRAWTIGSRIAHGPGWSFGVASTCAIVLDDFDGVFTVYAGGREQATFLAPGEFDRRGVRVVGRHLVVSRPGRLDALDVADITTDGTPRIATSYATPSENHGGALTQAWRTGDGGLLREYCGPLRCTVELVSPDTSTTRTIAFDTRGAGWVPSVPSTIAVSGDGGTLVFFRRNLDLTILDVATGRRQQLTDIAGPPRGIVDVAFAPGGARMAIAAYPEPWQITVLERE